jgi:hypothetical protein
LELSELNWEISSLSIGRRQYHIWTKLICGKLLILVIQDQILCKLSYHIPLTTDWIIRTSKCFESKLKNRSRAILRITIAIILSWRTAASNRVSARFRTTAKWLILH